MHSDDLLIERIAQGDQTALSALYDRYGVTLYNVAYYILQSQVLAEEVVQDVFLRLWRQADVWDPARGRLISWLASIARHNAIDRLRAELRRRPTQAIAFDDISALSSQPSLTDSEAWQNNQHLRTLIQRLPSEQAEVIELAFFSGLTHAELAARLDIPLGTIKTRLRLALRKLRDWWETDEENAG